MQCNCTAIGLCSVLKMRQWLGSRAAKPMAGKPTKARQNGRSIWLLRFLLLQRRLQDLRSTRLEAFAVERAIAADPDLSLLGRLATFSAAHSACSSWSTDSLPLSVSSLFWELLPQDGADSTASESRTTSCSASHQAQAPPLTLDWRHPPKRQGPRPKIVLDPVPLASSWSMGQEEERAKSRCSWTISQKASVMPPSTPFSYGCGRQNVCGKYCCEHWVLSHSAHTASRCYSKKNKTQTFSKENFSSPPYHEPQAPARQPAALNNSTPRERGYTLQFAQKTPWFSGVVSTSVQCSNAHVLHAEVMSLLVKGAMDAVSPAQSESGFYRRYFLVSKKDGGLRPLSLKGEERQRRLPAPRER